MMTSSSELHTPHSSWEFVYCNDNASKHLQLFDDQRLSKETQPNNFETGLSKCSSIGTVTFVNSRTRRGKQVSHLHKCAENLNTASLSLARSVGSLAARTGMEKQRGRSGQWVNFMAVIGVQGRLLMKEVPLLERAGIGAIAGGIAGAFTNAALHPIDTVKTKLQTRGASSVYKGPIDVVKKVLAKQGIAGFYCGLPAALVGSMVSSSVYFGMYELGKGVLGTAVQCPVALVPPFAAALGNITSSAILVPKEVIKQRMQAGATGTALEVVMGTLRNEGVGGLYAGYSAALLRNLPSNMLNFSAFEYMKAAWLVRTGKDTLEPWQSVLSGACAGSISAALTTPLDVVKTRLMTQARKAIAAGGASGTQAEAAARAKAIAAYTYGGVASTLQKIWLEEGARGLMRGMGPRIVYSACFSAVGFLSFETCRVFLLKQHFLKRGKVQNNRGVDGNVLEGQGQESDRDLEGSKPTNLLAFVEDSSYTGIPHQTLQC